MGFETNMLWIKLSAHCSIFHSLQENSLPIKGQQRGFQTALTAVSVLSFDDLTKAHYCPKIAVSYSSRTEVTAELPPFLGLNPMF